MPEVLAADARGRVQERHTQARFGGGQGTGHTGGARADDDQVVARGVIARGFITRELITHGGVARGVVAHEVVTWSPGVASARQARCSGRPLMVMRQSKQTPMPQNSPRGRPPNLVVRQDLIPAACKAAPTV